MAHVHDASSAASPDDFQTKTRSLVCYCRPVVAGVLHIRDVCPVDDEVSVKC